MALWWSALVVGTLLLVSSGVVVTIRAFRGRPVPRLGFFPPRRTHRPWWTSAALFVGIFLMSLSAGQLSEGTGGYLAYFGGAALVAAVVQAVVVWWHNRRSTPEEA
jgi:hypothetical protein